MIYLRGYILDDHHILSKSIDDDGSISWWMFTFKNPIVNGVVDCDNTLSQTREKLWNMEQIDPNNFEWNGKMVMLVENEQSK